jgi:acylphosphatase
MVTRQLRITGRVQGVGYRDALCWEAERLGVTGWVRNRTDGSVEALVQGEHELVEMLIAWARRGPPGARVAEVRVAPADAGLDRPYTRFERRPSA